MNLKCGVRISILAYEPVNQSEPEAEAVWNRFKDFF